MANVEFYIGIDPDVDKSGFALWDKAKKQLVALSTEDLFDLTALLLAYHSAHRVLVRLEAGWLLKKSNFSDRNILGSRGANERIAKNVGANQEIGRQIEKYCLKHGIPCDLVKPLGYSSWNHKTFCSYTGWPEKNRTNSEHRVAGMLVFGH
jgi:hypothetical protein